MAIQKYKQDFIKFMVECGVLTFGDFVTKSGRNTPFFINTGNYQNGAELRALGSYYAKAINEAYGTDFDILFGPAYKGIPLAVATVMALNEEYGANVRYASNRKEIKDHGDKGIMLGSSIQKKDKVVIIEDVTTAGTSIRETLPIITKSGDVDVLGLIVSVDRAEKGQGEKSALKEIEDTYGFKTSSIVSMGEVREYLEESLVQGTPIVGEDILKDIDAYYEKYGAV